jgi:hypothetical protein
MRSPAVVILRREIEARLAAYDRAGAVRVALDAVRDGSIDITA